LDSLHSDLCAHGHCDPLGSAADFNSSALNDMQALVVTVLARIGIGEHSVSDYGRLAGIVETRIRAVLNVDPL
jgi:hypothetical protein